MIKLKKQQLMIQLEEITKERESLIKSSKRKRTKKLGDLNIKEQNPMNKLIWKLQKQEYHLIKISTERNQGNSLTFRKQSMKQINRYIVIEKLQLQQVIFTQR